MNIHICGINYKAAPIEVRERLSVSRSTQQDALVSLRKLQGVEECVLLSTCNRTEVYVYSASEHFNSSIIENGICEIKGLNAHEYRKYFYFYDGLNAVRHLFKVTSGLDSMVLGEDQILGQVKEAQELAQEAGACRVILNTLFREAVTAAKQVKTTTGLSRNPLSVGSLAVKLISDLFGGCLKDKTALVIGMGKIGTIALKNLIAQDIRRIYVTNRSHGKASELAKQYGGVDLVEYQDRYSLMDEADIVISCTSSPHYTVTGDVLEKSVKTKKKRIFIDLALPRDMDEDIKNIEGVCYYNIDHLKDTARENSDHRLLEAIKAEKIIDGFIMDFEKWYEFRGVLPLVREIHRSTDDFVTERIMHTISRLKHASEEDKELVKKSMTHIVNSILNKFIYGIRENGTKDDIEVYFRCLSKVLEDGGMTVDN